MPPLSWSELFVSPSGLDGAAVVVSCAAVLSLAAFVSAAVLSAAAVVSVALVATVAELLRLIALPFHDSCYCEKIHDSLLYHSHR